MKGVKEIENDSAKANLHTYINIYAGPNLKMLQINEKMKEKKKYFCGFWYTPDTSVFCVSCLYISNNHGCTQLTSAFIVQQKLSMSSITIVIVIIIIESFANKTELCAIVISFEFEISFGPCSSTTFFLSSSLSHLLSYLDKSIHSFSIHKSTQY